jgi:putative ABC transport system permease protein
MLKNYLITAVRNLLRQKGTTGINIAGLTLGITSSLVLFLLVKHLSSFDSFHKHRDQIYRVVSESDGNNDKSYTSGVPSVFPDAFQGDFPEAEVVTFISYRSNAMITVPQRNGDSKKFMEDEGITFAEPDFFKIFDRKILVGSAEKGLDDPSEAIISQSLAKKYFGREDVVGEIVRYDTIDYKITAVMEDFPANTDFPFNMMLSYISIKQKNQEHGWNSTWSDEQCYFKLKEGESISSVEARIPAFVDKYIGKENYQHKTFIPQPLREMHFDERFGVYTYNTAPKEMLVSLTIVAIFLIITACINFINLSTAEAVKRSKEVGIRKSLGSSRTQLILQFLGETTMVTVSAMLISLGLTQFILIFLNAFLESRLELSFANDTLLWIFIVGVTALVSLLSGIYPSFVISGFRPAQALKNQINNRSSSGYHLRRVLVVLQFVISQFFIIGTIVLINQMNFFKRKELGFRKDAVLLVPIPDPGNLKSNGVSKTRALRNEVIKIKGVEAASLNSTPPSSGSVSNTAFIFEGEDETSRKSVQVKQVDGNYINLYEINLLAGTNIADGDTATGFLVNEELLRVSGISDPQDIIGKKIRMWGKTLPVVGVVSNFHTESLRDRIQPTLLFNRAEGYWDLSVKMNAADMQTAISEIKVLWEQAYPDHIFDYEFMDDHIREFYEGEEKMSILLTIFSGMAICIGCLGLLGLATFLANQKTKEIGVRKAMGATVESIVFMFTKEYVKLIVIGFAIAAPLAWLAMNEWLNDFEYRIDIGPAIFIAGFAITLLIALITVGYKSLRAALVNPVESLRWE